MARLFSNTSYLQNASGLGLTNWPISLACWFKTDHTWDTYERRFLMSWWYSPGGESGDLGGMLAIGTEEDSGVVTLRTNTSFNSSAPFSPTISDPTVWNHGLATIYTDEVGMDIYLNGGTPGHVANYEILDGTPDTFSIADYGDGNTAKSYIGDIAEAAVWNVKLTQNDALVLAAGYSPLFVKPQNLVDYWSVFGRISPESGIYGGYDLTLTGSPTQSEHPAKIIYPWSVKYGMRQEVAALVSILSPAGTPLASRPYFTPKAPVGVDRVVSGIIQGLRKVLTPRSRL